MTPDRHVSPAHASAVRVLARRRRLPLRRARGQLQRRRCLPTRAAFDRATLAFLGVLIALTGAAHRGAALQPARALFRRSAILDVVAHVRLGLFHQAAAGRVGDRRDDGAVRHDAEWAVRLGAPLAHARRRRRALCARAQRCTARGPGSGPGVGWLMLPGVFFSSSLISTDALLLPLWAIALFAMWRLVEHARLDVGDRARASSSALGALAKYAMLYFVALHRARGVVDAAGARRRWRRARHRCGADRARRSLTPNIDLERRSNGFATARHTAANARFDLDDMFHFDELFEFIGGQAGVIGPLHLPGADLGCCWRAWRRASGLSDEDKFLLAYILPPFVFITHRSPSSRAPTPTGPRSPIPPIVVWVTGSLFTLASTGGAGSSAATAINVADRRGVACAVVLDPAIANRSRACARARALGRNRARDRAARRDAAGRAAVHRRAGRRPRHLFRARLIIGATRAAPARRCRRCGCGCCTARRAIRPKPAIRCAPKKAARVLVVHLTAGLSAVRRRRFHRVPHGRASDRAARRRRQSRAGNLRRRRLRAGAARRGVRASACADASRPIAQIGS